MRRATFKGHDIVVSRVQGTNRGLIVVTNPKGRVIFNETRDLTYTTATQLLRLGHGVVAKATFRRR